MTTSLIEFLDFKLNEKWRPVQISGWLHENAPLHISHETIYQHVWSDKKSRGNLFKTYVEKEKFTNHVVRISKQVEGL